MVSHKLLFNLEQPNGNGEITLTWQKSKGELLVTTGADSVVNIYDKTGEIYDRLKLPNPCNAVDWDADGDYLAIIFSTSNLILWNSRTKKKTMLDLITTDPATFIKWSLNDNLLAVGSQNGHLSIYNPVLFSCIPLIGRHTKKITCGDWNSDNVLIVGSEDKRLSITNAKGELLRMVNVYAVPTNLCVTNVSLNKIPGDNSFSVILDQKKIVLYNIVDLEHPVDLSFENPTSSSIVNYKWYSNQFIFILLSSGKVISITTGLETFGKKVEINFFEHGTSNISICHRLSKIAAIGSNKIKFYTISNLFDTKEVISFPQAFDLVTSAWSDSGELFAVGSKNGCVNVYSCYEVICLDTKDSAQQKAIWDDFILHLNTGKELESNEIDVTRGQKEDEYDEESSISAIESRRLRKTLFKKKKRKLDPTSIVGMNCVNIDRVKLNTLKYNAQKSSNSSAYKYKEASEHRNRHSNRRSEQEYEKADRCNDMLSDFDISGTSSRSSTSSFKSSSEADYDHRSKRRSENKHKGRLSPEEDKADSINPF